MTKDKTKQKIERGVFGLLSKKKFRKACMQVASYEAKQKIPRGIGIEWKNYNPSEDLDKLKIIFESKPKILDDVSEEQLNTLRIAAGMMHLWGTNNAEEWLAEEFGRKLTLDRIVAARMLVFHANYISELQNLRETGFIEQVEILGTHDSCIFCQSLATKKYSLDDVPELPHKNCSNELGGRCTLLAVV